MHIGFVLILFVIYVFLLIQTDQTSRYHHQHFLISRKHLKRTIDDDDDAFITLPTPGLNPNIFFQNEPTPLDTSVVDDLTTLASATYIISVILIVFLLLVWITHYHAPCSSIITSLLSAVTGLPESVIHSVALCGSCCVWCETTWVFRRIHQFNIWLSNKIKQLFTRTCKILFDTICPCCQPPDTPTSRSIIGEIFINIMLEFFLFLFNKDHYQQL